MDCTADFFASKKAFDASVSSSFSQDDVALFTKQLPADSTITTAIDHYDISFTTPDHVIKINSTGVTLRVLGNGGIGGGGGAKAAPEYTYVYDGGLVRDITAEPFDYPAIGFSRAVFIPLTRRACPSPLAVSATTEASVASIEQAVLDAAACAVNAPIESYRIDVYRKFISNTSAVVIGGDGAQIFNSESGDDVAVQLLVTTKLYCDAYVETSVRFLQSASELVLAAWCANTHEYLQPSHLTVRVSQSIINIGGGNEYGEFETNHGIYPLGNVAEFAARGLLVESSVSDPTLCKAFPQDVGQDPITSPYFYDLSGPSQVTQVTTTGVVYVIRTPLAFAGFASLVARAATSSPAPAPVPVPLPSQPPTADPMSVNWFFIIVLACLVFAYILGGKHK